MFYEYAKNFFEDSGKLLPFKPYPTAADRAAWEGLPEGDRRALVAAGEEYLNFSYPYLPATDFMAFSKDGERIGYESKQDSKRMALSAVTLAECVCDDGRFLDQAIDGIYAICDEAAWQIPAHNTYVRDQPQLVLPDVTNPVIELVSCETGAVIATSYYLLGERLDAVSPFIGKRVGYELSRRIIKPYLNRHFWWMGRGNEQMNNWTVWCTQNVLLTAFLADFPDSVRQRVFLKAAKSIDYFLKEYWDDGCCDEGAQYYRHAGLCLFQCLDILCQVTGGYFSPLWQEKKIRNIAGYILNVHVDDKYYVNFADCSPIAGRAGAREYLFGKRTKNDALAAFAKADYAASATDATGNVAHTVSRAADATGAMGTSGSACNGAHTASGAAGAPGMSNVATSRQVPLCRDRNLYYRLQEAFTREELLSPPFPTAVPHHPVYYASCDLFIARNDVYVLAVKGGDNNDGHNHNDVGSITLYKGGRPFLIDVGVETYTKKTFSPQRYEIWTMQSDYHNLPTINGQMQQPGPMYRAELLSHEFSEDGGCICLDIAKAYDESAGLASYVRTTELSPDGVILYDRWQFADGVTEPEVVLNFMTYEKPRLNNGRIAVGSLGEIALETAMEMKDEREQTNDVGSLRAAAMDAVVEMVEMREQAGEVGNFGETAPDAALPVVIEEIPITDQRLAACWKHPIYRVRVTVQGVGRFKCRIK